MVSTDLCKGSRCQMCGNKFGKLFRQDGTLQAIIFYIGTGVALKSLLILVSLSECCSTFSQNRRIAMFYCIKDITPARVLIYSNDIYITTFVDNNLFFILAFIGQSFLPFFSTIFTKMFITSIYTNKASILRNILRIH